MLIYPVISRNIQVNRYSTCDSSQYRGEILSRGKGAVHKKAQLLWVIWWRLFKLSPGLGTLGTNPRRTLGVPSAYPRRQARTLGTVFCGDSLDRSLVLDI